MHLCCQSPAPQIVDSPNQPANYISSCAVLMALYRITGSVAVSKHGWTFGEMMPPPRQCHDMGKHFERVRKQPLLEDGRQDQA